MKRKGIPTRREIWRPKLLERERRCCSTDTSSSDLGFVGSDLQRWESGRFMAVMLGIREYVLRDFGGVRCFEPGVLKPGGWLCFMRQCGATFFHILSLVFLEREECFAMGGERWLKCRPV